MDKREHVQFNDMGKRLAYRVAVLMRTARVHSAGNKALDYSLRSAAEAATILHAYAGDIELIGEESQVHVNTTRLVVDKPMQAPILEMNHAFRAWSIGGLEIRGSTDVEHWRELLTVLESLPVLEPGKEDLETAARASATLSARNPIRLLPMMRLQRSGQGGGGGAQGRSVEVATSTAVQLYVRALVMTAAWFQSGNTVGMPSGLSRVLQSFVELVFQEPRHALLVTRLKSEVAYEVRHPVNSTLLALSLGRKVGLQRSALMDLAISALCADLGMISLPIELRRGQEPADLIAQSQFQRHPLVGARMALAGGRLTLTARRRLRTALEHHRGFDHSGWPRLSVPLEPHLFARLYAVAEQFDALTTERPGRAGLLPEEALEALLEQAGRGLDPALVSAMVNLLGRYPLGTAVLLSTGELGVVFAGPPDPKLPDRPLVRLLVDPEGQRLAQLRIADLRDRGADGAYLRSVARSVNPASLGVDVSRALLD